MKKMANKHAEDLNFHIYAGSLRGVIAYTECQKNIKPTYELKELDGEITAFEWGQSNDEIILGNKNGVVKVYNTGISKFIQHVKKLDGKGAVVGLASIDKNIIIGRSDGTVNVHNRSKKKHDAFRTVLNDEATMNVLVYNEKRNVFATGGENNDLKVWDINTRKDIFKAKSLGKDMLELPIPTSIRGISFHNEDNIVSCITKEGMMLLYDEKAQRKPVCKYEEKKASFTCVSLYRDRQLFVGTTKGYIQLIDMRQGKCVKTFQPFAGAVTSIICDQKLPYVVSTSLDKHLRIHNVDTKEVVHKEYMKIGLTKLLMRPVVKEEPKEEDEQKPIVQDDEYEGLFENMETINDCSDENDEDVNENSPKVIKRKKKSKIKGVNNIKKVKSV
ncbi:WD repeat-containing protein 74 [Atheta coriaria]|uniref:WD repeat-containing protein 74 n=1 Tax=Dalotia coriaria TaxID=877792 RepID=UPI0031F46EA7